jgi:hypothetical protein
MNENIDERIDLGMNWVATQPRRPERTVMRKRADMAARNTTSLLLYESEV